MIRPNRSYSFVSASQMQPKNLDFSNAKIVDDVEDVISGNSRMGEFKPDKNNDLNTKCHSIAERVVIALKTLESGAIVNDAYIVRADDTKVSIRLFGTEKKTVEPRVIEKAELAKMEFHYCISDGKRVGNAGVNSKGVPCIIPTIYLHL